MSVFPSCMAFVLNQTPIHTASVYSKLSVARGHYFRPDAKLSFKKQTLTGARSCDESFDIPRPQLIPIYKVSLVNLLSEDFLMIWVSCRIVLSILRRVMHWLKLSARRNFFLLREQLTLFYLCSYILKILQVSLLFLSFFSCCLCHVNCFDQI